MGKGAVARKKGETACDHFFYDTLPSILVTSGFGCQTVKIIICLNHSHISPASISLLELASANLAFHHSKKTKL